MPYEDICMPEVGEKPQEKQKAYNFGEVSRGPVV